MPKVLKWQYNYFEDFDEKCLVPHTIVTCLESWKFTVDNIQLEKFDDQYMQVI